MSDQDEVLIDVEDIEKRYEAKGFFKRLGEMFRGLGRPHDSREYKLARIELQRLLAPLVAVLSVSSPARYSSILSTRTFILLLRTAFSFCAAVMLSATSSRKSSTEAIS